MALLDDGVPPEDLPYLLVDSLASSNTSVDANISETAVLHAETTLTSIFADIGVENIGGSAKELVELMRTTIPRFLAPSIFSADILPKIKVLLDATTSLKLPINKDVLLTLPKYCVFEEAHIMLRRDFALARSTSLPKGNSF